MGDIVFMVVMLIIFLLPAPSFLSVLLKAALLFAVPLALPTQLLSDPLPARLLPIALLALLATSLFLGLLQLFTWQAPLESWAEAEGVELIHISERAFFRGPFFWGTSNHQLVYRIAVQDKSGAYRWGWACFGGYLLGLFAQKLEVRWST